MNSESLPMTEIAEEQLLKVPADMAIQAMELALKSGMKNVRIEII